MLAGHRESHRALLRRFTAGSARPVDAIMVPAGRSTEHLRPAAQLTSELGATLLVMCSPNGADPGDFGRIAAERWSGLRWRHLHVPDDFTHPLLPATASPTADSRDWRHGPLSTMRNLALLMARMLSWHTVLLLDDDITGLGAPLVRQAASGLDRCSAVGFTIGAHPDNSVVCHANRLAGGQQDVFVGACALLLDTTRPFGFFPNLYNEDWLFLYDEVTLHRVSRINSGQQIVYDPYLKPGRAVAEEFGEIIAEGLMAGLHDRTRTGPPTDVAYWARFLDARRAFIADAAARIARLPTSDEHRRALDSLAAAERRRRTITAEYCASYIDQWRADLTVWHDRLAMLRTFDDFDSAADHLGLSSSLVGLTN